MSVPEGWREAKLDECLERIIDYRGQSVPKAESGVPLITARNVRQGRLDFSQPEFLPAEKYDEWMVRGIPKAGDVLFTTEAPLGNVAPFPDDGRHAVAQRTVTLRGSTDALDNRFLLQYLLSEQGIRAVQRRSSGSTATGIRQSELRKVRIPLPPLAEQRRIAEILGTWDEAIALVERRIAAARRRKQGLMQRLLTGRVRFPGFAGDWREVRLGEVCQQVRRPVAIEADNEYRLLGVRWYVAGARIHDNLPGSQIQTSVLSRIHSGDILYNKMWVTKSAFAVAGDEHDGAVASSEYPQFRANPEALNVRFLAHLFHNTRFQYDATCLCRGTTGRARLNPTDFLQLRVSLPGIKEQSKIAAILDAQVAEIDLLDRMLAALQRQKKGLMQRLLTGRVRVVAD